MAGGSGTGGVAMVDAIASIVEAEAAIAEAERTLTANVVEAMWSSGLMRWMNPAVAGGAEPSFAEMIDVWERMAEIDGSFGWIGIANLPSAAAVAAYLPEGGFRATFGSSDHVTMGGQFAPNGKGERVDGGYRISGSWNFGSGTGHSEYVCAGFLPVVDEQFCFDDDGEIVLLAAVIPREEIVFTDGWHVQGLRATGSFDYHVVDLFVPDDRVFGLFERAPLRGSSPVFSMGLMAITAAGHAAWILGVAKSMLDDVRELSTSKVRMGDLSSLANRESFQRGYAHHLGMWRAADLLVRETFGSVESAVASGAPVTPLQRADMRIAATYATEASREIAQWAHLSAGTTAIREGSRLERAFRDIYTGTQHAFINEKTYIQAAQIHLGIVGDHRGL